MPKRPGFKSSLFTFISSVNVGNLVSIGKHINEFIINKQQNSSIETEKYD